MHFHLLRISFIFTLIVHSMIGYGQTSNYTSLMSKKSEPLYLLNSTIIANGLFTHLNLKNFKSIIVYKDHNGPSHLSNISSSGIIDIVYTEPISSKSLSEIALQQQLSGPVVFFLNGNKLDNTQVAALRIVPEAIDQLLITHSTSNNLETIVNIRTATSKEPSQNNARVSNERRIMIR